MNVIYRIPSVLLAFKTDKMPVKKSHARFKYNKAGYTATRVACGWAGAVVQKLLAI